MAVNTDRIQAFQAIFGDDSSKATQEAIGLIKVKMTRSVEELLLLGPIEKKISQFMKDPDAYIASVADQGLKALLEDLKGSISPKKAAPPGPAPAARPSPGAAAGTVTPVTVQPAQGPEVSPVTSMPGSGVPLISTERAAEIWREEVARTLAAAKPVDPPPDPFKEVRERIREAQRGGEVSHSARPVRRVTRFAPPPEARPAPAPAAAPASPVQVPTNRWDFLNGGNLKWIIGALLVLGFWLFGRDSESEDQKPQTPAAEVSAEPKKDIVDLDARVQKILKRCRERTYDHRLTEQTLRQDLGLKVTVAEDDNCTLTYEE